MSDEYGRMATLLLRRHTRLRGPFGQVATEEGTRRSARLPKLTRPVAAHANTATVLHPFAVQADESRTADRLPVRPAHADPARRERS